MRPMADVPELGVLLGGLAAPVPRDTTTLGLDRVRLALVSRLFETAGAARGALVTGDEPAARAALRHAVWLEAWHQVTAQVEEAVVGQVMVRLQNAAVFVHMPPRRLAPYLPDARAREVIRHRLEAAAIPLERVLPPEDVEDWPDGIRRAARALGESWERLEVVVREELALADERVAELHAWRRPTAGLWGLTAAVLLLAVAAGLWIGGFLEHTPQPTSWGAP